MWCKNCKHETTQTICELCNTSTEETIPVEVHWCKNCKTPIIRYVNDIERDMCSICGEKAEYLSSDLRPVFPEERLLIEILLEKPLAYIDNSISIF